MAPTVGGTVALMAVISNLEKVLLVCNYITTFTLRPRMSHSGERRMGPTMEVTHLFRSGSGKDRSMRTVKAELRSVHMLKTRSRQRCDSRSCLPDLSIRHG